MKWDREDIISPSDPERVSTYRQSASPSAAGAAARCVSHQVSAPTGFFFFCPGSWATFSPTTKRSKTFIETETVMRSTPCCIKHRTAFQTQRGLYTSLRILAPPLTRPLNDWKHASKRTVVHCFTPWQGNMTLNPETVAKRCTPCFQIEQAPGCRAEGGKKITQAEVIKLLHVLLANWPNESMPFLEC